MKMQRSRYAAAALAILAGGQVLESASCSADVFQEIADRLNAASNEGDTDLGDWLADEVDHL